MGGRGYSLIGGSCDADQESMDEFQEWPQVSYFVLYSHVSIIQVCPQGGGVGEGLLPCWLLVDEDRVTKIRKV